MPRMTSMEAARGRHCYGQPECLVSCPKRKQPRYSTIMHWIWSLAIIFVGTGTNSFALSLPASSRKGNRILLHSRSRSPSQLNPKANSRWRLPLNLGASSTGDGENKTRIGENTFQVTGNKDNNSKNDSTIIQAQPENGLAIAVTLSLTYFTVMGAKCALPSVLPLLKAPYPQGLIFPLNRAPHECMAQLFLVSTTAIALGKLLLGPAIDYYGGSTSLKATLIILSSLFGFLAFVNQSFTGFFLAYIGVDFVFSACWAACLRTIHEYFPPSQWSRLIGNLATGARAGNAVAFLCFAQILKQFGSSIQQPWRPVFGICAVAQVVPLSLLFAYCRRRPSSASPPLESKSSPATPAEQQQQKRGNHSLSSTWKIACREARKLDFWLHLTSRSVLMVFASFLLFVPTVMTQVYQTSAAFGSQTGSAYAAGCLLAVVTASNIPAQQDTGRPKQKVWVYGGLLTAAALSSAAHLAHVSQQIVLSPTAACASFFLWGCSMAIPFYIPASLYALKNGGTECAATIADLFDMGGFGLLASFNGYVAGLASTATTSTMAMTQWIPTFVMTTACALISLVTLCWATWREQEHEQRAVLDSTAQ